MPPPQLTILQPTQFDNARMIIGLDGWMDGGDVSTGTVETIVAKLGARLIASLQPRDFYIYNVPGPMEVSALFRPHIELRDGLLTSYAEPDNLFFANEQNRLILFRGKEPNLNWDTYAECIFALAEACNVTQIYFVGSVAGLVPHTRGPRLSATVSDEQLKPRLTDYNIKFSNYQGPGSIVNLLLRDARRRNLEMITLVAEIPAYVQGKNPKCIDAVVRRLAAMLGLELDLNDLRAVADEIEKKLDRIVAQRPELAQHIKKLEANYDEQVFDTEMPDLKDWLQQQGIRLD